MSVADSRTFLTLVCTLLLSLTAVGGEFCGKPGSPYNGYFNPLKTQYNVSETVEYGCNNNSFAIVGNQRRRCLSNETWDNPIPTCELNVAYSKRVYGDFSTSGGSFSDVVDNRLDTSFNLDYGKSITVDLGQEFPIAYVMLSLNPHTRYWLSIEVSVSSSSSSRQCYIIQNKTLENASNKFTCNNGYALRGRFVKVKDQSPFYASNPLYELSVFLHSGVSKCGEPDIPSHGKVIRRQDEIRYSCYDNYALQGEASSWCVNGRWNATGQYCYHQPVGWVGCGEPGLPNNGERYIEGKLQDLSTYTCNKGAVLYGNSLRTCLVNGTWSPQQIPKCVTNVALNKMAKHQRFGKENAGYSVDGDEKTCENQQGLFYGYIDLGKPILFDKGSITIKSSTSITVTVYVTNNTAVTSQSFNNQNSLTNFCVIKNVIPTAPLQCNHLEVARFVVIYLDKSADVCEVTIYNSNEATSCGQPDLPLHGQMKLRKPNLTTYECDYGYSLKGSATVYCNDGAWSAPPPQCISIRSTLRPFTPTGGGYPVTGDMIYTTTQPHPDDGSKSDNMTMGIMGIAVGATAACVAIILVSFLVYCFVRKHYKNRSRCDHDHSSRGSRSDTYTTSYRLPNERRCGDGDDVSIHLYDSIKDPEYNLFNTRRLPNGGRPLDSVSNDVYNTGSIASNTSNEQRHRLLPPRPPLYDAVTPEVETVPSDNRGRLPLPGPDDPLLDFENRPRTSL